MGEKAEKTREMIREEAYGLFADKGFQAVTMTDICEKTGLSRGGLYRYYSSTGEIFSEILSKESSTSHEMEEHKSAIAILEEMLRALEEEILARERSLSLAIYEYANLGNQQLFISLNSRAKKRWLRLIEYGMETGEFQQVDPEQVSDLIMYYYQGLRMWSRVIPFDQKQAEHYRQTVWEMLVK